MNISTEYELKLKHGMFAMGSLFRSPAPPSPPPVPSLAAPDPEEEARKERLAALERRRRGRTGTIATSERGVLLRPFADGKQLLGE